MGIVTHKSLYAMICRLDSREIDHKSQLLFAKFNSILTRFQPSSLPARFIISHIAYIALTFEGILSVVVAEAWMSYHFLTLKEK